MRGGMSDLVGANQRRQRDGAAVQVATARADLASLGVTKDVVVGRLRRLHQLAERRQRAAMS